MTHTFYRGSVEYVGATVSADVTLDSQAVAFSFDRTTWYPGEWVGALDSTREARLLVDDSVTLPAGSSTVVYLRVTDDPETPIVNAGTLKLV